MRGSSNTKNQKLEEWIHSVILDKACQEEDRDLTKQRGIGFAPANIALCKYWGKRDSELNLPMTNSLSISLGKLGAYTEIESIEADHDQIFFNGKCINAKCTHSLNSAEPNPDALRISNFLDLFRGMQQQSQKVRQGKIIKKTETNRQNFRVSTISHLPVAAGLASSAAGFAALTLAINDLFGFGLELKWLSVLARLGSGSACRSLWPGFVEWQKGEASDGSDSHGVPIEIHWPELRIGLLVVNKERKHISSRIAMENTCRSSFYSQWPARVEQDLMKIKKALNEHDFISLGEAAEANAMTMHGLMMTAEPPILYSTEKTIAAIHHVQKLRKQGLPLYFTQDAGPNLKLLFLQKDLQAILGEFPDLQIINPFLENSIDK